MRNLTLPLEILLLGRLQLKSELFYSPGALHLEVRQKSGVPGRNSGLLGFAEEERAEDGLLCWRVDKGWVKAREGVVNDLEQRDVDLSSEGREVFLQNIKDRIHYVFFDEGRQKVIV